MSKEVFKVEITGPNVLYVVAEGKPQARAAAKPHVKVTKLSGAEIMALSASGTEVIVAGGEPEPAGFAYPPTDEAQQSMALGDESPEA